MSTSKHIDRICCIVMAMVLILTAFYINAEKFGIAAMTVSMGYEERLFATDKVHTIDIVMDDWEGFLDTCENEEYELCALVIDNEAYKNVGIRAKGNTSLSAVAGYGNDRYSFKVEFDHYDSTKTYYGLDKISLNNIIQDNTYMKDYLSYQMMGYFGVSAPLCSYVYITVNGEDWGLYLAVEGVEESFLERNYGADYGELYKPDSTNMGGGRGNGGGFDMDKFKEEHTEDISGDSQSTGRKEQEGENSQNYKDGVNNQQEEQTPSQREQPTEGAAGGAAPPELERPTEGEPPAGMQPPMGEQSPTGLEIPTGEQLPAEMQPSFGQTESASNEQATEGETEKETLGADASDSLQTDKPENATERNMENASEHNMENAFERNGPEGFPGRGGQFGGKDSEDVSLIYSDDNFESYTNIFDNAKTDPSDADKTRLIRSLKNINEVEDIENSVNIEAVMRYFVVHNFVCNFDSYTGSMIHNYYLYEENGQMSMIPWDYNLAFGGFLSESDAGTLINYPIDTPVSGGSVDSRPMLAWIFQDEQYTEQYHQLFAQFISEYFDSGYFTSMIDTVTKMITPYVEKDPTKFCTYEEFEKGASTLKEFCLLRAESISGQLDGSIPSTSEGQASDDSACIDGSGITISDMGTMGEGMRHNAPDGNPKAPDGNSKAPDGNPKAPDGNPNASGENTNASSENLNAPSESQNASGKNSNAPSENPNVPDQS